MTEIQEVENLGDNVEVEGGDAAPAQTEEKTESKSKRPPVPAGWGTPIQFAKVLTEKGHTEGWLAEGEEFKPQVVYSYVKNPGKNNPFPVHHVGPDGTEYESDWEGSRPLLKLDENSVFTEALEWWDAKEERKKASKAAAAEKASKKTEKTSKPAGPAPAVVGVPTADEFNEPVEEAE